MSTNFQIKNIDKIETLGEKLKKHRQQKGLSQEKAASAINLNVRYIKQLENNDFQNMPADIYAINILKNYATLLNINPNIAVEKFKKEKALFLKTKKQKEKQTNLEKLASIILNPKLLKYLIFFIIISAVLGYIGLSVNKIISPPFLEIYSPQDNIITTENEITVSGKTDKEVNLYINNRPLLSSKDGNFSLDLDLQKGLNVIKISAEKKHSKKNILYRQVFLTDNIEVK